MFGRISINGSVEWLAVPDFRRTYGPTWTANILATRTSWEDNGSTTNTNWVSQSGGDYGSVSVPWNCIVCVLPVYHHRVSENTRAAARHVHDNLLRGNRLARMQNISTCRNPIQNRQVNRKDDDWDGLVDQ